MTEPEYVTIARRLRAEGLTFQQTADKLNEAGYKSAKGKPISNQIVANALLADAAETSNPHELLKRDPNNRAALMDLADRRRYFESGKWSPQRIRAVAAAYSSE